MQKRSKFDKNIINQEKNINFNSQMSMYNILSNEFKKEEYKKILSFLEFCNSRIGKRLMSELDNFDEELEKPKRITLKK